ncbi:MAG: hypothetical protein HUU02_13875, partial [Bacteroidetes bacterium]|nr:hypothetical protein [Bacteroidota bacterium]
MKQAFWFLLVAVFLISDRSNGQTPATLSVNPAGMKSIEKYESSQVTYYHFVSSTNNALVGKQDAAEYDRNAFRMVYRFDISNIPINATITGIEFINKGVITTNSTANPKQIKFYLKKFPYDQFNVDNAADNWGDVSDADNLDDFTLNCSPNTFAGSESYGAGSSVVLYVQGLLGSSPYVDLSLMLDPAEEATWGTNRNIHVIDFNRPNTTEAIKLIINYTTPNKVSLTFQNNFVGGTMGIVGPDISNPNQVVPYSLSNIQVGSLITVTANEQNDELGNNRVWANSVVNEPSRWVKNGQIISSSNPFGLTADIVATYEARLRKRFNISQNDQTDFDGSQSMGVVSQIIEQNSGTVTAPLSKTVNNRNYLFYKWSDGVTANQRTISNPTSNQTLEAYYKAHFLSNETTNFETAGAHKFIRTGDGTMHLVYRSTHSIYNGHTIFYETSTDNGSTWQLRYSGRGSGSPAIAAVNNNQVVVAYPSRIGYNDNIVAVCYDLTTSTVLSASPILTDNGPNAPSDVSIAITSNGKILVAWYNSSIDFEEYYISGYYARYGTVSSNGVITWLSYYDFEGSTLTSRTATHG